MDTNSRLMSTLAHQDWKRAQKLLMAYFLSDSFEGNFRFPTEFVVTKPEEVKKARVGVLMCDGIVWG